MSDYEKELEKRLEEHEERLIKLQRVIRPFIKLLVGDNDEVIALKLLVDIKTQNDPMNTWIAPSISNAYTSSDMLMFVKKVGDKWLIDSVSGNQPWEPKGQSNILMEETELVDVKFRMLKTFGLELFPFQEFSVPYNSEVKSIKDSEAKSFADKIQTFTMQSDTLKNMGNIWGNISMGVSAKGLNVK